MRRSDVRERCRFIADKDVPDGRYQVPGCWLGVADSELTCADEPSCPHYTVPREDMSDAMKIHELEKRVAALERLLSKAGGE